MFVPCVLMRHNLQISRSDWLLFGQNRVDVDEGTAKEGRRRMNRGRLGLGLDVVCVDWGHLTGWDHQMGDTIGNGDLLGEMQWMRRVCILSSPGGIRMILHHDPGFSSLFFSLVFLWIEFLDLWPSPSSFFFLVDSLSFV